MCELLAMNCRTPTDICFSFTGFCSRGGKTGHHKDGWGVAFYESGGLRMFLDNLPAAESKIAEMLKSYSIKSMNVLAHIRKANIGSVCLKNNQPFCRELWGKNWVFMHNGDLYNFEPQSYECFRPVGDTDSERAFCVIMNRIRSHYTPETVSVRGLTMLLQEAADELSTYGVFNFIMSDGDLMFAHRYTKLSAVKREYPFHPVRLVDEDVSIDFTKTNRPGDFLPSYIFVLSYMTLFSNVCRRGILSAGIIFLFSCAVWAQGKFELVSEEDIKEYYEKPVFVPDARISARNFVTGKTENEFIRQRLVLNIASEVNRDVSVFASLTNRPYLVGTARDNFYSYNETERTQGGKKNDNDLDVIFDQAYIAYYSNPCTLFKAGQQALELGDREGIVYRGKNWAVRNQCTIGTWPYDIGFAKIGPEYMSSIRWLELRYPVYNNGQYNKSLTLEDSERQYNSYYESGLDIEIYRIYHNTKNSPVSYSGHETWGPDSGLITDVSNDTAANIEKYHEGHSPYHLRYDSQRYLYADINQEFWGVNLDWYYYWYMLAFKHVTRSGSTTFYAGKSDEVYSAGTAGERLENVNIYGRVYRLQNKFFIGNSHKLELDLLYSEGQDAPDTSSDTANQYVRRGFINYAEIISGTYENNGLVYFNAYTGAGEGHSVSNLVYYGLSYKYASPGGKFDFSSAFYRYHRQKAVVNTVGEKVKDLAAELGLRFRYKMKPNLAFYSDTVYFVPGDAYVQNDSMTPDKAERKDYMHMNFGMNYTF
ncbi:hypothetical protein CHS0354_035237 [Potamilus streckersoni]|uniref:Glutamine amidotransferase type-2 domain-containing protein n=1 Tax=Potamilus streckersoni TaxID=2493646 RepID=A0AAE0S2M6_9BIVA|nr:hypothetical protein CHS0354_035237 [Potamilus streckersoni]